MNWRIAVIPVVQPKLTDLAGGGDDAADRGHVVLLEARQRDDRVVAGDAHDRREQRKQSALGDEGGDLGTEAAGAGASWTMTQRPVLATEASTVSSS